MLNLSLNSARAVSTENDNGPVILLNLLVSVPVSRIEILRVEVPSSSRLGSLEIISRFPMNKPPPLLSDVAKQGGVYS